MVYMETLHNNEDVLMDHCYRNARLRVPLADERE